jgi:chromosome segregation ATPase
MTMDDTKRDQIKESIKNYLFQFESYSRAIQEIQVMCSIPPETRAKLPIEIQEARQKQQQLSKALTEESADLRNLALKEKPNSRRMENKCDRIKEIQIKLLQIDEKLKGLNQTKDSEKACIQTGPEVKQALSTEYKLVLDKLADARRQFPDIYSEVEKETKIYFFTPFK